MNRKVIVLSIISLILNLYSFIVWIIIFNSYSSHNERRSIFNQYMQPSIFFACFVLTGVSTLLLGVQKKPPLIIVLLVVQSFFFWLNLFGLM